MSAAVEATACVSRCGCRWRGAERSVRRKKATSDCAYMCVCAVCVCEYERSEVRGRETDREAASGVLNGFILVSGCGK